MKERGKIRFSQFCSDGCRNEYSRRRYQMRKLNAIDRVKVESEIRIHEESIKVYKDYLKLINNR
ncbi:hypothetical protein EPK97_13635 [Chengkuizengella sediminis]|nr:hypothetical protein [Chengkuizengella sediminis]